MYLVKDSRQYCGPESRIIGDVSWPRWNALSISCFTWEPVFESNNSIVPFFPSLSLPPWRNACFSSRLKWRWDPLFAGPPPAVMTVELHRFKRSILYLKVAAILVSVCQGWVCGVCVCWGVIYMSQPGGRKSSPCFDSCRSGRRLCNKPAVLRGCSATSSTTCAWCHHGGGVGPHRHPITKKPSSIIARIQVDLCQCRRRLRECVCVGRGRVWTDGSQGHSGQAAAVVVSAVMMSAAAGSLFARLDLFVNNDPFPRCRAWCRTSVGWCLN